MRSRDPAPALRGHVTIASRCNEAEHTVRVGRQLDQNDAAPRTRQEVDLLDLGQNRARLARRGNQNLLTGYSRNANEFGAIGSSRESPAGPRTRLDERGKAESHEATNGGPDCAAFFAIFAISARNL